MNPRKMIEILLTKISLKHKIFYMEQRTYKDNKIYKHYKIKIDDGKAEEFGTLTQLLLFLKEQE